jgi:hypothetical protein
MAARSKDIDKKGDIGPVAYFAVFPLDAWIMAKSTACGGVLGLETTLHFIS